MRIRTTALLKRLGENRVVKWLAEINVIKRVAEIVTAVTVVGVAIGWVFGPRIQVALGQEIATQLTEHRTKEHVPISTALGEINTTLSTLSKAQAEAKAVQLQTTSLLGLIVCKDAGGTPYPSADGGLCIFTKNGARSIPLSNFNTLFAEALARSMGAAGSGSVPLLTPP